MSSAAQVCPVDFDAARSYVVYDDAPPVAVGDFDGDGLTDVVTSDGGEPRPLRGIGHGWLKPLPLLTTGTWVEGLAAADFNGDGRSDVMLSDTFFGRTEAYVSLPGGGFALAWRGPTCGATSMDLADFDGDGNIDVAAGDCDSTVYLGNGDGTFPNGFSFYWGVGDVTAGDVDGDGIPDIVGAGATTVIVMLGLGDGSTGPARSFAAGHHPEGITLADLDGDGDLDAATANVTSSDVTVLLGVGDGTFLPPAAYQVGGAHGIDSGDLDGDGDVDLVVVSDSYPSFACVLRGNGDGTFVSPACYRLNGRRNDIVLADAEGDGDLDVFSSGDGNVAVLLGRGDGTFTEPDEHPVGRRPRDVAVADMTGDGLADIVTADYSDQGVSVLPGAGDGTFGTRVASGAGGAPLGIAVADFDGDGIRDAAAVASELVVLRGVGGGFLQSVASYPAGLLPRHVVAADLDGSGTEDLVVTDLDGGVLRIFLGRLDGTFSVAAPVYVEDAPGKPAVADVDGDGSEDLVVTAESSHDVHVALGNGDGTFRPAVAYPAGLRPHGVAAADLSGDGILDLAVAGATNREVSVFPGLGGGVFGPRVSYPARHAPDAIVAADVDGDGDLDILVTSYEGGSPLGGTMNVTLLVNEGGGVMRSMGGMLVGESPAALAVADLDHDGGSDVVVADEVRNHVLVALNAGLAIDPPRLPVAILGQPYSRALSGSGGTPPYSFSLGSGTLPPGLALAASGLIQGVPSTPGVYAFEIAMADATCSRVLGYRILVRAPWCPPLTLFPERLPQGFLGSPYATSLATSGGTAPYVYDVASVALPPGLVLDPGGLLSGTPTATGSFEAEIASVDAAGCVVAGYYLMRVVACAALTLSPASLPPAVEGSAYGATLAAAGGLPPYVYVDSGGALPAGLALASATGEIAGVPAAAGSSSFIVTVTDAGGCAGTFSLQIDVELRRSFVLGQGLGPLNANRVRLFSGVGLPVPVDFLAYGAGTWGVNVATGGIDAAPADDEILTGPGPGPAHGPQVKAFRRDAIPIAKVNFFAYGTLRFGVNVDSGELDADGFGEILTGAGPGAAFGPHVRGFNFDGGAVAPMPGLSFHAFSTLQYGANVAAGDIDGSGSEELLAGPGPGASFAPTVRGFRYTGVGVLALAKVSFNAYALGYGVHLAAGDVDRDGFAEIATAAGPGATNPSWFKGFGYDAAAIAPLPGYDTVTFPTLYGGRVALGDVTGAFRWDLLAGAGRDPAAASTVRPFAYLGYLSPLPGPYLPFPGGYGVNPGAGRLGW